MGQELHLVAYDGRGVQVERGRKGGARGDQMAATLTTAKLCQHCKHFRSSLEFSTEPYTSQYATCFLTAKVFDQDGEKCVIRRGYWFGACGPKGKQWAPK